jgi:hypothetical protein
MYDNVIQLTFAAAMFSLIKHNIIIIYQIESETY